MACFSSLVVNAGSVLSTPRIAQEKLCIDLPFTPDDKWLSQAASSAVRTRHSIPWPAWQNVQRSCFCKVLCWFSPWLSLLVELSGVPAHPTLPNASCQPIAEETHFHSLLLQPLKKERERKQLSFPVYGWDQMLSCIVIPWSFPLGIER